MTIKGSEKVAAHPAKATAPHDVQQTSEMPGASSEYCERAPQQLSAFTSDRRTLDSTFDRAQSSPRVSTQVPGETLLTPRDILIRLNMTSADPTKWMRRTFEKHDVPYVRACGKMRATEGQYQMLLEKITCSPPVLGGKKATIISKVQSLSGASESTSKSSIQERVTRMLRRA